MAKRKCILFLLGFAGAVAAQQTVAPAPETAGPVRGENRGDYNITQSFETGYRWTRVFGSADEYRSDANYGNGVRLLGSSLSVFSKDGHGRWFDEITLNTEGLGNDPYESALLRVQKNSWYRYELLWRLSDYANAGLTVAGGLHMADTSRRLQDHELTLFPQARFQLQAGYSRDSESGPVLATAQEFDVNGQGYPVFTDVRRAWNEYRLGGSGTLAGFKLTVMRRWDFYKDDTPATSYGVVAAGPTTGNIDLTVVNQFNRSQPVHGSNPGWTGNVFTRRKRWGLNARLAYNGGRNDFAVVESALGTGQFGAAASRQIAVGGNARRPDTAGTVNVSFFPSERLTLTNNTSVSNNRIDGDASYTEVVTGTNLGETLYFRRLGIRTVTNSTLANLTATKWLGVYGGWNYSDRRVETTEGSALAAFAGSAVSNAYEVVNQIQSGVAGVRVRPVQPLSIDLDGEVGRSTQPLTPIADNHFHALGGRADYRTRKLQFAAAYRQNYNNNQPIQFQYSYSHARTYSASGSWTASRKLVLDASYTRLHLDTWSFLAFFAGVGRPTLQAGFRSQYVSNIHAANLGARMELGRRANLYVGYSITKDVGDGRTSAAPVGATGVAELLDSVQTFPLTYQSPLARVSVKITEKVRWNAGWQFYDYAEQFGLLGVYQNFHAHTGYSSLTWAF